MALHLWTGHCKWQSYWHTNFCRIFHCNYRNGTEIIFNAKDSYCFVFFFFAVFVHWLHTNVIYLCLAPSMCLLDFYFVAVTVAVAANVAVGCSVTVAIDVGFSFSRLYVVVLIGICCYFFPHSCVCYFLSSRCFVFIYVFRVILFSFSVANLKISTEVVHEMYVFNVKEEQEKKR